MLLLVSSRKRAWWIAKLFNYWQHQQATSHHPCILVGGFKSRLTERSITSCRFKKKSLSAGLPAFYQYPNPLPSQRNTIKMVHDLPLSSIVKGIRNRGCVFFRYTFASSLLSVQKFETLVICCFGCFWLFVLLRLCVMHDSDRGKQG